MTRSNPKLPHDPRRRCPVCHNLFSEQDWMMAYVGSMSESEENHLVIHEDCFLIAWNEREGKPISHTRGLMPGPSTVGGGV